MRSIFFLLLLNCSSMALAHTLTDNPGTFSDSLHVLLSLHHPPMMMLFVAVVAVVIAVRVNASMTKSQHPR